MFNPKEMMSFTLFDILKETVKELEGRLLRLEEENAILMEDNERAHRLIIGFEDKVYETGGKCFGHVGWRDLVWNHCDSDLSGSSTTCDSDVECVDERGFSKLEGLVIPSDDPRCIFDLEWVEKGGCFSYLQHTNRFLGFPTKPLNVCQDDIEK